MTIAAAPLAGSALVTTRLAVPGMRCAGCIAKIETGLPGVAGILEARANISARVVTVRHAPGTTLPDLKAALAAQGFDADALVNAERTDATAPLLRALAVAGFAAMNVMLLSVSVWSGADGATRSLFHWLSALIAIPAVAYAGRPFFASAWAALSRRRTNMDVPISIGVLLATGVSLYETARGGPHAYFDSALMLLAFLLIGRVLDEAMRSRARTGAEALVRQTAPGALVLEADGRSRWVAAEALRCGQRMLVASGERLAADGVVSAGAGQLDLSLLTGESGTVPAVPGDRVIAGALNLGAPIEVQITAVGDDRAVADIARLMDAATQSRSRYVRLADRAARIYAPAVHLLALASFAGWMVAGAGWHTALLVAVAVLIITCPCALGLAVPVAQVVASGALMRAGILVKDGSALERLAEVDCVLFDKTGTLTLGQPQPDPRVIDALTVEQRQLALALARASRHPLAQALRRALEPTTTPVPLADVREQPGEGVTGRWHGLAVALARPEGATTSPATALWIDGRQVAAIGFTDPLRDDAAAAIAALGLPAQILSGDRTETVAAVGAALGIDAVGGLLPADKLARIDALMAGGARPLMVGDGLNDGPALARAHASMAPSSASDVGVQAADLVFLGDRLAPVPAAVRAARRTMRIVRQNFALAIGYNVVAVPLAIAGLVTPLIAAAAMSASSLIVIANALRLRGAAR